VVPGATENPDPEGRMPGQVPATVEAVQPDYHSRKREALEKVRGLSGKEVLIKSGRDKIRWKVVCNHDLQPEDCLAHNENNTHLGLKNFSKAKVKQLSASEFLIGLGLLIRSAEFAQNGKDLFVSQDQMKHAEVSSSII